MAKEKKDALATTETPAVPAFLEKYVGKGTEHFQKDDLQIPRLALAQGLSPQLNPEQPEYIKGLVIGSGFNNATNEIYDRGPWDIAIVKADRPRWVEFIPREQGGGIKDPNVPYDDPRTQWGANGEKPIATKFYDYIIVFLDTKETIAISLSRTGIKVAKKLNTMIYKRGPLPLFMGKYSARSVMVKGKKGDYATFAFVNDGFIEDEEMLKFLAEQFDTFKNKEVVIDREPGDDTGEDDEEV